MDYIFQQYADEEYDQDGNETSVSSLTSYTWEHHVAKMPCLARQPDQETLSTFQPITSRPSLRPPVLQSEPEHGTALAEIGSTPALELQTPGAFSVRGIDGPSGRQEEEQDHLMPDQAAEGVYGVDNISEESPGLFLSSQSSDTVGAVTIMAELAPDDGDIEQPPEESLGRQQSVEIDRPLEQERQSPGIAEAVNSGPPVEKEPSMMPPRKTSGASGTVPKPTVEDSDNFKILSIHRRRWAIILFVLLLLIAGGVVTFMMLLNGGSSPNGNESSPTDPPSASPTSLVTRRWNFLLNEIGQVVMPNEAIEAGQTPVDYFADTTTPQYRALEWMAEDDLEFDIFAPPTQELVERYVVTLLYFATSGPTKWIDELNFVRPGRSVCDWNNFEVADEFENKKGIRCHEEKVIIDISLLDNGLQGPLIWELSLIRYLIKIDLGRNDLFGTLPIEWSSLSNLLVFYLDDNHALNGTLPSEYGNLTTLKQLNLVNNTFTGTLPVNWSGMTNLTKFDAGWNRLEGTIPTEYGLLTDLQELRFESNILNGTLPTELGNLAQLEVFSLTANSFSGQMPTEYARMTSLREFFFQETDLTGDVDSVFCDPTPWIDKLKGDCLPEDGSSSVLGVKIAEINCTCCTSCCNDTHCVDLT